MLDEQPTIAPGRGGSSSAKTLPEPSGEAREIRAAAVTADLTERLKSLVDNPDADDFTRIIADYGGPDEWELWRTEFQRLDGRAAPKGTASFEFPFPPDGDKNSFRVLACSAYNRRAWSLTLRGKADKDAGHTRGKLPRTKWTASDDFGFTPAFLESGNDSLQKALDKLHLFSFGEIVRLLDEELTIGADPASRKGLLLVTGRTGCGKSEVARGLVNSILGYEVERGGPRKTHLVTFEDPIEKPLFDFKDPASAEIKNRIDYTPRQLGKDCRSFEEATRAALRQTPAVFYAGEIRDRGQMRTALEFAATGHLIVATAHSGCMVEGVSKILESVRANNPASRAEWASRIRGVVHMEKFDCEIETGPASRFSSNGVLPALYKRTARAVQSLVADGNFSLLPGRSKNCDSLGHAYFAERLAQAKPDVKLCNADADPTSHLAREWAELSKQLENGNCTPASQPDSVINRLKFWLALRGRLAEPKPDKNVLKAAMERDICA